MAIRSGAQRNNQNNRRRNNQRNSAMQNRINNNRNRLRNTPASTPEEAEELENKDNELANQQRQLNRRQANNNSSNGLQSRLQSLVGVGGSSSSETEESGTGNYIKKIFKRKIIKYSIIALAIIFAFAVIAFIILSPLLSIAGIVDDKVDYTCETIYVRKCFKHDSDYVKKDTEEYCYDPEKTANVYVYEVDENDGYKPYDFEEYVAMVVTGEVGSGNSSLDHYDEVMKAAAVAARSYGMAMTSPLLECKIMASDMTQTTSAPVPDAVRKAVKDTKGEVLTKNGAVYLPMYDAFACIDRVNKNGTEYYVLEQPSSDEHQMIPVSWISENGVSLAPEWTTCNEKHPGNHGQGMSQVGAAYLADELDYDYHEILFYYYSDDIDGD